MIDLISNALHSASSATSAAMKFIGTESFKIHYFFNAIFSKIVLFLIYFKLNVDYTLNIEEMMIT